MPASLYNEMELKAASSNLKVCWEPSDEDVTRIPLELSNYGSIINTRGRWLLIAPYNITHPCSVNIATIKVGRQGQWRHIFFKAWYTNN